MGTGGSVSVGAWASLGDGTKIHYVLHPGGAAQFTFADESELDIMMTEEVLEQCVVTFSDVLHNLRAANVEHGQVSAAD